MGTIDHNMARRRIEVRGHYEDRFEIKESDPSRRWDPKEKIWWFGDTALTAINIAKALPNYERSLAFQALLPDITEDQGTGCDLNMADIPEYPFDSKTTPWQHQIEGVSLIEAREACLLFWEMGTGKTKCVVDWICNYYGDKPILIACPRTVCRVWEKEFRRHGCREAQVLILGKSSTSRDAEDIRKMLRRAVTSPQVIVGNFERLWRGDLATEIKSRQWALIVADEIQRIKSPGGKASRFMSSLRGNAEKRVGLSGTPMPNGPLDAYSVFRFLDTGLFGTSFTRFRARYAVMGGFKGYEVKGYQRKEELQERMAIMTHRVRKDEVLDLPDIMHEELTVDLTPGTSRVYKQMETDYVADVESGVVTASNVLSRLLRLQQIASGFLPVEDKPVERLGTEKSDALADLLEDLPADEPIVVFCRFKDDLREIHRVADQVGRQSHELSGGRRELEEWQEASSGEVLAVQIQAGGVGVDMTRARYCAYYSLGFSLGDYEQSLARIHRSGQDRKCTYYHIVARGTVDRQVYGALRDKANVIDSVTAALGKPSLLPVPPPPPTPEPEPLSVEATEMPF